MSRIWLPGGAGGADLDVITAGAGDVLSGKVIVDKEGEPLTEARRPQMRFTMRLPQYAPPLSIVRAQRSLSPNSPA